MVENRPRARATLIWIMLGLALVAVYFVFIASGEADNNASDSGGQQTANVQATSTFGDTSQTPAATAIETLTPAP